MEENRLRIDAAFEKLSNYASADDDMALIYNFLYFVVDNFSDYPLDELKEDYATIMEAEKEDE